MSNITQIALNITEAVQHWQHIEPYAKVPVNKAEYRRQRALLDKLMEQTLQKNDKHMVNLLELIARNLQAYEEKHFPLEHSTPIDILKFLMQEHGITQSNFPEIGSQSLVSKILTGKRKLTAEQIANLAKRFHLSPAVFY